MRKHQTTIIETAPGCARKRNVDADQLFVPSIHRYTCHGIYSVSSRRDENTKHALGTCHGVRSQIEHVMDLNVIRSRDEAIGVFASVENGPVSRSRISLPEARVVTPFPETRTKAESVLPTDDQTVVRESWGSVGLTQIEYLKLTDVCDLESSPEIVAVAPSTSSGSIARHTVELRSGVQTSWFVLGLQQLAMSWTLSGIQKHSDAMHKINSRPKEVGGEGKEKDVKEKPHIPSSEEVHFLMTDENPWTDAIPWDSVTQAAAETSLASSCFLRFSKKLIRKMHSNSLWLYHDLQKDMLGRTIRSGKRIASYMPKTAKVLAETARRAAGFGGGREDDDGKDETN